MSCGCNPYEWGFLCAWRIHQGRISLFLETISFFVAHLFFRVRHTTHTHTHTHTHNTHTHTLTVLVMLFAVKCCIVFYCSERFLSSELVAFPHTKHIKSRRNCNSVPAGRSTTPISAVMFDMP